MALIIDAVRTPIGKIHKSLSSVPVDELGAIVIKSIVHRNNLNTNDIDEVIFSNLINFNFGNLARISSLKAGLPISIPAVSIDRQCSSSLNAVAYASMLIDTKKADVVIAGGAESCSQQPQIINNMTGTPMNVDVSVEEIGNPSMIESAENIIKYYNITRKECDMYAIESHKRAALSWEKGLFNNEVIPVTLSNGVCVEKDECVRFDCSIESLSSLRPVMNNGIVTPGNCTTKNDGASAVLVVSENYAKEHNIDGFKIDSFASAGCDPNIMGLGPIFSTKKLLDRLDLQISDFDIIELNEAFAVQVLACMKELNIKHSNLNVCGGAIALGHPYSASGGILLARIINEMKRKKQRNGLITFCCGGGQGFSMAISHNKIT